MDRVEEFQQHLTAVRSERTVEAYVDSARRIEAFLAGFGRNTDSMIPNDLQDFVDHMARSGLSPASIRLHATGASRYLGYLRRRGARVPDFFRPSMPRVREKVSVHLTEQALAVYMQIAREEPEPYRTALLMLPLTGLRVRELCRLRLSDLRIQNPWVIVTVRGGKSARDREVPLLRAGNPLLAGYLRGARAGLGGGPYLFPGATGGPMRPPTLREHMRQVRQRLGITGLTPHSLRHTYLTILNRHGITGFTLAEIAGHRGLTTTRLYVHPSTEEITERMAKIPTPWAAPNPALLTAPATLTGDDDE